eukprot:gene988-biopygen21229
MAAPAAPPARKNGRECSTAGAARGENRTRPGRVPDASRTIEFEGTDASRTRPEPFLPVLFCCGGGSDTNEGTQNCRFPPRRATRRGAARPRRAPPRRAAQRSAAQHSAAHTY